MKTSGILKNIEKIIVGTALLTFLTLSAFSQVPSKEIESAAKVNELECRNQIFRELKNSLDEFRFAEAQSEAHLAKKKVEDNHGKKTGAFCEHIQEALRVNIERRSEYSRLTNGKSDSISKFLIWLERFSLIPAKIIDRWGRSFQEKGIGIIQNDFVSMQGIKPLETPPKYRKRLGEAQKKELKRILKEFQKKFFVLTIKKDFRAAADLAYHTLQYLRKVERENESSLILTVHFVESLGYGALHGIQYSRESKGTTNLLSKTFLLVQLVPFVYCLPIDFKIQKIHEMGVGIVENDVPAIPFETEWIQGK